MSDSQSEVNNLYTEPNRAYFQSFLLPPLLCVYSE